MSMIYVDTSALMRAYLADEPEHEALRDMLLAGDEPVVTSELTRLEITSAVRSAARGRRVADGNALLDRFDSDCADSGVLTLLRLDADAVVPKAHQLVSEHRLRTLDAIHLAVAVVNVPALTPGEATVLVTRDQQQATAAKACGLEVA